MPATAFCFWRAQLPTLAQLHQVLCRKYPWKTLIKSGEFERSTATVHGNPTFFPVFQLSAKRHGIMVSYGATIYARKRHTFPVQGITVCLAYCYQHLLNF
jgi:hypothetical protein